MRLGLIHNEIWKKWYNTTLTGKNSCCGFCCLLLILKYQEYCTSWAFVFFVNNTTYGNRLLCVACGIRALQIRPRSHRGRYCQDLWPVTLWTKFRPIPICLSLVSLSCDNVLHRFFFLGSFHLVHLFVSCCLLILILGLSSFDILEYFDDSSSLVLHLIYLFVFGWLVVLFVLSFFSSCSSRTCKTS
jgi:hypothetical protein